MQQMSSVEKYFFKLVCVNENNPLEYEVLEDVNLANLSDVHTYVTTHINRYGNPEFTKWMLLPMKKCC